MTGLKETWSQSTDVQAALLQTVPEAKRREMDYFKQATFEEHEEIYQGTLDYMVECLEEVEPHVHSSPLASSTQRQFDHGSFSLSHLPPIKIPPFSGKPEEWESFCDRFSSLIIDNSDLTAFARMHFLASSLTGRALEAIKTVPITADNFEIAWKVLVSRYDNKRRLVDVHVSALYDLPTVNRESAFELNELRDRATRAITSLKNLGRSDNEILSDMLVYSITQKLDQATRKAWKLRGCDNASIPTFDDLDHFLAARARALEELTSLSPAKSPRSRNVTSATANTASPLSCPLCKANHFLNKCPQFVKMNPNQRLEIVRQHQRCLNCLSVKHTALTCPSKYSCRTYQKRHHSMLHIDTALSSNAIASIQNSTSSPDAPDTQSATALLAASPVSNTQVLLATARVTVRSTSGRSLNVRALLDQGSELTFISEKLSQILKLNRIKRPISISAVGGVDAGISRYAARIQISPVNKRSPVIVATASMLRSITNYAPAFAVSKLNWDHLAELTLADPTPSNNDPIELIIGADLYGDVILEGLRKGSSGQPIAQRTIFGWVLSGPSCVSKSSPREITVQHCSHSNSLSLDRELRRFWEIEEIPRLSSLSPDEQKCETHFLTTHSRAPDGRYVVRLPFKAGPPISIGHSRGRAERCLNNLTRRFKTNIELKRTYTEFMSEYEQLGHMRKAPILNSTSQCVYIPHHAVLRDSSVTTRLRVVFNASSLTSNATSLNDHLIPGPKLQTDLTAVILRWRQFKYVYSADIAKMYRQILVDPRDTDYQRILWPDRDNDCVQEYQLLTVTYGWHRVCSILSIARLTAVDQRRRPLVSSCRKCVAG